MDRAKNVWFINFPGIGNAVMLMPVLAAFERQFPRVRHFHTESVVYRDDWFLAKSGVQNLAGLSAAEWRRFSPDYWPAIADFMSRNAIDLVVNLRNEGPKYDRHYYQFKEQRADVSGRVRFMDFDFPLLEQRPQPKNLFLDIVDLVTPDGGPRLKHQTGWLAPNSDNSSRGDIGFGLAASQRNKRWSQEKWRWLANHISAHTKRRIFLFPGISEPEVREAVELASGFRGSCEVIERQPLSRVASLIAGLGCFVSNDTGLLHIAAAAGVPAIGIYTNTNPSIWAPCVPSGFWSFTNWNMFKCEHLKPISGNCLHYYDACPALEKFPDTIDASEVAQCMLAALAG